MNFEKFRNDKYFSICDLKDHYIDAVLPTGFYAAKAEFVINEVIKRMDFIYSETTHKIRTVHNTYDNLSLKVIPQLKSLIKTIHGDNDLDATYSLALDTCAVRDCNGQICLLFKHDATLSRQDVATEFSRILSWKSHEEKLNCYFSNTIKRLAGSDQYSKLKVDDVVLMKYALNGNIEAPSFIGKPFNPFEASLYEELIKRAAKIQTTMEAVIATSYGYNHNLSKGARDSLEQQNNILIQTHKEIEEFLKKRDEE